MYYLCRKLCWCLLSETRYCHDSWRLCYVIFTQETKQVAKFMDDWHTLRLATVICWLGRDSYHRHLLIPRWFVQKSMMCRSNANPMPFPARTSRVKWRHWRHFRSPKTKVWSTITTHGSQSVLMALTASGTPSGWMQICRHMLHRLLVYRRFTGSRWFVAKWGSQFNQFR